MVFERLQGDFTDGGNAAVFVERYYGMAAYCDALGWLCFDGQRWVQDEHQAVDMAKLLTEEMLEDARADYAEAVRCEAEAQIAMANDDQGAKAQLSDAKKAVREAKAYLTHATQSRMAGRIRGMLELSKSNLIVKADKLDADPFTLNTPAGIVNLLTSKLTPHDAGSPFLWCTRMTKCRPMDFDSEADQKAYDVWSNFLDEITCHDYSLAGFLQMVAGMALIGKVFHEGILIATGSGRNGKSTLFNAFAGVLGDYAGTIDSRVLTTDRQNKGAALATLRGRRLVLAAELEEHQRLSTSTLKQLASTDMLTIEEKYRAPESVRQTHTLVLFTNHLPRVGSTDNGTWRRLTVVPFNAVISENRAIQNYADVLVEQCGSAILSWAIEGAALFIQNGYRLTIPDAVAEATEEYRAQENWVENFISDRCIRDSGARIGARTLYLEYKAWAEENGEYIRRERDFSAALENAGYQKIKPKGTFNYIGLRINYSEKYGNPCAASC